MTKKELDTILELADEACEDAEDNMKVLMGAMVKLLSEELLQLSEIKRNKLPSIEREIVALREHIAGKMAVTRYDVVEGELDDTK